MKPSQALAESYDAVRRTASRYPVANLRVFGSVARGEDDEGGDLDLLVDALPGATLLDLGAMQEELTELLKVPVDVVTPGDLPKAFRRQVLAEARSL